MRRHGLCVLSAVVLLLSVPAWAETIPLAVDFGGVAPGSAHFVKGGIPFARGVLKGHSASRLLEDGEEAPLQTRTLATWPDGSVKWMLVDFQASAKKKYVLEFGKDVTRKAARGPVKTGVDAEDVTVDTGVIRFVVRKSGCGFIDELSFDVNGNGKYEPDEKVVKAADPKTPRNFLNYLHVEKPEDYPAMSHFAKGVIDRSKVGIDEIRLEEPGPLRVCVRIRGKYLYEKVGTTAQHPPRKENQFTVRIHAWRGSGLIRAEHTFVFEGDPDHDFVRTMGLALDAAALKEPEDGITMLFQQNAGWAEVRRTREVRPETIDISVVPHALFIANDAWGMYVGIRRMRELYPKSLWLDRTTGRVVAYLYPPEARPLDMRRYARSEYGVGEGHCYELEPGKEYKALANYSRSCSRGIGRSHDVFFSVYRGRHDSKAAEAMEVAQAGAVVRGPLEYMAETRVLGSYRPFGKGQYADVWKSACKAVDYVIDAQERFKWYGFFDYGDQQHRYNAQHRGRWAVDWGRWGWGNNDGIGRYSQVYGLYYLATGERKYFDALEAAARHNIDVDIMHTDTIIQEGDPYHVRGFAHRHGVQHWSGPYMGLRGSTCVGYRIYYFLTGEERVRDVLEEVVDCAMRDHYGNSGGVTSIDGGGAASMALLTMWEITGDTKYRDKLQWKVDKEPEPKDAGYSVYALGFGQHDAFVNFLDLTGSAKIRKSLIKQADILADPTAKKGWRKPFGYMRTCADAYRVTGDEKYRTYVVKVLDEYGKFLRADARVTMDRSEWPGRSVGIEISNITANWGYKTLPYAIWVAEKEVKK